MEASHATSVADISGVAVGTILEGSSEGTIGGPPPEGANLHPLTRVCAGVAVPPCSDPCLHRLQVRYRIKDDIQIVHPGEDEESLTINFKAEVFFSPSSDEGSEDPVDCSNEHKRAGKVPLQDASQSESCELRSNRIQSASPPFPSWKLVGAPRHILALEGWSR